MFNFNNFESIMNNPSILQQLGYTWLALPKEGLMPLQIIQKEPVGFFRWISGKNKEGRVLTSTALFDLFPPPEGFTALNPNGPKAVAKISGHDLLEVEGSKTIEGLKAFQAVANIESKQEFELAKKLLYDFRQPQSFEVNYAAIEKFINKNEVDQSLSGLWDSLIKGKLYVVLEALQTSSLSVQVANDFSYNGHLSAEAISGYVAKVEAEAARDHKTASKLEVTGNNPVTFAIKMAQIKYKNSKYQLDVQNPLVTVRSGGSNEVDPILDLQ